MRLGHISLYDLLGGGCILGLVGVIVLPLMAHGRDRAARANCLASMKQVGAGVMLYTADYSETLPVTTEFAPKRGFGAHWSYLIQPYLDTPKRFLCPADQSPAYTYQDAGSHFKVARLLSYINNYAAIPAHDFYPVPRSALTDPANLILIAERRSKAPNGTPMRGWKGTSGFFPGQPCADLDLQGGYRRVTEKEAVARLETVQNDKDLLILRTNWTAHDDFSNYIFTDGHARSMKLAETLEPTNFKWGERFYPRAKPGAKCDPQTSGKTSTKVGSHPPKRQLP